MSNKSIIVTNGDMVRAMTDEELAGHRYGRSSEPGKNGYCRKAWQHALSCRKEMSCKDCYLAWLKAPAGQHQKIEEEKKP